MPFSSGFFNSTVKEDTGYGASDFAEYFKTMVRSGVFVTSDANALNATASSTSTVVTIAEGALFVNGYLCKVVGGGHELTLDVTQAQSRTDAIVLRLDLTADNSSGHNRAGSIYPFVIKGTP